MKKVIQIHPSDNVSVALTELYDGEMIDGIRICGDIPRGHKIALRDISAGENVVKYGYPIGAAVSDIAKGSQVHTHNVKSTLDGLLEYSYTPKFSEPVAKAPQTFMGYRRKNGRVGIRNEVWIIPTVGCVNSTVREIENAAQAYKNDAIDGIYSYNHPYGCSQLGEDKLLTLKFLCGLINHPNACGVLVVGLGCENGNIEELKKSLGDYDKARVKFLNCQDVDDEIECGTSLVRELCRDASLCKREECSTSELIIGLKCGGSDGLSGITANPLLGQFSDRLISEGGSTILTEVPEMFGAETILMNRCRNKEIFDKTVSLINDFKAYFLRYGEKIDENPSPGNKAGGITTLADKSLGCTQKGGTAPVEAVLRYGEPAVTKGLNLLEAPGNDLVASCALVASGAQIVLFTTGRGTPFACPVPTVKISSSSALAAKKSHWIDFNSGRMLEEATEDIADEFYTMIIRLASGELHAKSERLDKHELAIFKDGVTL